MYEAIEEDLQHQVGATYQQGFEDMYFQLAYHMGWEGEDAGPETRGKRIRPLLVLLVSSACGGEWRKVIPVASAVEMLHNFSLVHDDIQDQSLIRRGRPTVWKRWGLAQAINTGDTLFVLANLSFLRIAQTISPVVVQAGLQVIQRACLELTQGQYLDLSYEARGDLSLDAYWPMVSGKTAAIISASTELGALTARAEARIIANYRRYGRMLGLAFQVQDDLLGIWGDAAVTGKSSESDLLAGKKSLPVLYGLNKKGVFASRWNNGGISAEEVPRLAAELEKEGARDFTLTRAKELTNQALQALQEAQPQGKAGEILYEMTNELLSRKL